MSEEAKQECIKAIEASMIANKKRYELEVSSNLMTEKEHKAYLDTYHKQRIELLILKGDIPKPTEPKTKYDSFGSRIKKIAKPQLASR